MYQKEHRRAKVTPETIAEAAKLRAIWDANTERPSQAVFGERYEIGTQPAVGFFLNGQTPLSLKAAMGFAKGLNCSIADFSPRLAALAGNLSSALTQEKVDHFFARTTRGGSAVTDADNVAPVQSNGRIPLISWVQAGQWSEIADNFAPGEADDWIAPSESKPGRHSFALTVVGDSMTSPYTGGDGVTFPAGTIIIVDPDQSADAGHFVVAKDVETQKATFKKLMYDGGRWYLKPLNPEYKTVEIDDPAMRVIGRVVEFQGKRGKL